MVAWFLICKSAGIGGCLVRPALVGAALAGLAACSLNGIPRLDSSGTGLTAPATVSIIGARDTTGQKTFGSALAQAFTGKGLSVIPDGNYLADFAISVRPSDTAIAVEGDNPADVNYVSVSNPKKFLQECSGQRLRTTLVIHQRSDTAPAYRGTREIDLCNVTEAAISEMAQALVADALDR